MSTFYDAKKIRHLADTTNDPFWLGASWVLRQQEAAQLTGHRAAFMSDKISMDEARARAMREGHAFTDPTDYDSEWTRGVVPAPARGMTDANRATIKRLRNAANLAE